ncbi:hypothetical protein [Anaerosacchariphilus polymeriproducens]|uniref:LSM domain protein n=1 Tax=Anaerosacchariphilus polymeriproducens TaxID=1812858 RepID=A0A371AQX7_9FIRM|nr:hypothetical protein [Anaerosacchariphilus polymeriproducens]RDU21932.1 hypothetical protein DWV06_15455 [Anaerosacchariphilus polymeriproducens]
MVNIWDFANSSIVKLRTIEGNEYKGKVVCVDDAEEDEEVTEDSITIDVKGKYIGFNQSEIEIIEEVK